MNKKDLLIERTSISDIKEIKGEDGVSRHELNTPTKIIVWIKYQFEQQEIDYNKEYRPFSKRIDLSNCIINTSSIGGKPSLKNLFDILKANDKGEKLDCFINNGFGNKYNHEVKVKIDCRNSLIHSGFFQNTKFHESVNFEDSTFDGYASFSNCLFTKYANFQNVKFIRNSNFDRCIFNEDVYFNKVIFDTHEVSFDNSIFKGNFHGQSIEFKTDPRRDTPFIDFRYSEFHKDVDLSYSKFNRACYFGDAKFHGNILFRKTHFEVSICFYDTVIGGNILFTAYSKEGDSLDGTPNIIKTITFRGAKISGRIDFENCEIDILEACFAHIQKGALFRIYESKIKRLDFTSVYNDGAIMLEDNQDNIEEITFKSALNTGLIEIENTNTKTIKDRKTARLLKDSANKSGNTIDALEYRKKELELFKQESTYMKRGTRLLLRLNGLSNDHGTDWIKGLIFTTCSWLGFYLLFLFVSRLQDMFVFIIGENVVWTFSSDISNGISYLWSLDFLTTLSTWMNQFSFQDSWWIILLELFQILIVTLIFILGKIAIAYGIYQTITAFRKYKN